jgi:hypothetical protein
MGSFLKVKGKHDPHDSRYMNPHFKSWDSLGVPSIWNEIQGDQIQLQIN